MVPIKSFASCHIIRSFVVNISFLEGLAFYSITGLFTTMLHRLLLTSLVFLVVLNPALAEIAECEVFSADKDFAGAGNCYKENEEWDYCIYHYLKAGRKAEKLWDRGSGDYLKKGTALNHYSINSASCLTMNGDTELTDKVNMYASWLENYVSNPTAPPFDMDEVILTMEQELYAPPDQCASDMDCSDGKPCTKDLCSGTPKTCSNTPITECLQQEDGCCPSTCGKGEDYDCADCHSNSECTTTKENFESVCEKGECVEYELPECAADSDCEEGFECINETCVQKQESALPWWAWILITIFLGIVLIVIVVGGIFLFKKGIQDPEFFNSIKAKFKKKKTASEDMESELEEVRMEAAKELKAGKPKPIPKSKPKPAPAAKPKPKPAPAAKPRPAAKQKPAAKPQKDPELNDFKNDEATKELEKIIQNVEKLSDPKDK